MNKYVLPKKSFGITNPNTSNSFCTEVEVNSFGYERIPANKSKKPVDSSMPSFRLHYIVNGSVTLSFGGQKVKLDKNSVFCLIPKTDVTYSVEKQNCNLDFFWVVFEGSVAKKLLYATGITIEKPYAFLPNNDILQYFAPIFSQKQVPPPVSEDFFYLSNLFGILSLISKTAITDKPVQKNPQQLLVNSAIAYINDNFTDSALTLKKVASEIHVHPNYLSRIFKNEMQTTFIQYLTNKRLCTAYTLMDNGMTNIGEIAQAVGFNDGLYFSRIYKKYNNVSPKVDIVRKQKESKKNKKRSSKKSRK